MRGRDVLEPTFEQYVVPRDFKRYPIKKDGIHGVATNDADYVTQIKERLPNGKQKIVWRCPAYDDWNGVIRRSCSSDLKLNQPTYKDVTVCPEWLLFSNFRNWWVENNVRGWQLDKDILQKGNLVYCPDSCIYVPGHINKLLIDHAAARGDHSIGVYKDRGLFKAQIKAISSRTQKNLGYFHTSEQAHKAWQIGKIEAIKESIDKYTEDANFLGVFDVRIVNALNERISTLEDDIANGRETLVLH